MTVSAQETIFRHVGNGVTVTFAYGCQVLQPNDLYVYVDDVEITSGVTKNGIAVLTGGTVTFDVAPAAGAIVILEREVELERITDYQQNGDFLARTVNPDFNRIWMALQQQLTSINRSLRLPRSDPNPASDLPAAADRADKLLSFDSNGNPVAIAAASQSATALQILLASIFGPDAIGYDAFQAYADGTLGSALSSTLKGDAGKVYQIFAFVVRNDGTNWDFIDDIDHRPTNMASVAVLGDDLRVTYGVPGARVVTHIVGTDETMAALGMTCGPSVGLSFSNIKMYIPFACWVENTAGTWSFGAGDGLNPWFGPGSDTTITSAGDGSGFTINHKTASGSHPPVMTVLTQSGGGAAVPGGDIRLSYGGNTIIGTAHAMFEGYVIWVGPNPNDWTVDTPNIAKPTFVFSAGVLTVTHENLGPDTKGISIDGVSGVYLPASGSATTATSFQVVFQDYTGANIAVANGNMRFRYMRPRSVKSKAPDGMRVAVQRGPVLLEPTKVVSVNGNLWGLGLLEIL